jgi:3-hydroxyacyl-[acyl-carrier-protein] dehydratase
VWVVAGDGRDPTIPVLPAKLLYQEQTKAMKFGLVDNIIELTPGERIVTVKAVSLAEEYLADHFPTFPVLPGVLMLQALVESATWLIREATDFAPSLILLREAKNVTYKSFVKPGNLLRLEVSCRRMSEDDSDFSGCGFCNETEIVKARFGLTHISLTKQTPSLAEIEKRFTQDAKSTFARLRSAG